MWLLVIMLNYERVSIEWRWFKMEVIVELGVFILVGGIDFCGLKGNAKVYNFLLILHFQD